MSKPKSIYTSRNSYTDRTKKDNEYFSGLNVKIETIDTALLLLNSNEEIVLIAVLKHITEFIRKQKENINDIKEKNMLELLLEKEIYISNDSAIVRRCALYIFTAIIESMNTLLELEREKISQIMELCLQYYICEDDDFCIEYLSVIINQCLNDPHVIQDTLDKYEYLDKLFTTTEKSENPDVLLHSFETLNKMILVQNTEAVQKFTVGNNFPIDRIICELTNEFEEICSAALKVVKALVVDTSEESVFGDTGRAILVLKQLTKLLCEKAMSDNASEIIEVLATALRNETMAQFFFEQNLFDAIIQNLEFNVEIYPMSTKCNIISVFAETAKFAQFLNRLYNAHITDLFLDCLLLSDEKGPAAHVIIGLNRLMKFTEAANKIISSYEEGLIEKLLKKMRNPEAAMKTREQCAEFLGNLLVYAFHNTAKELIRLDAAQVIADIFAQGLPELSIDYILALLNVIETLAQNSEYREYLGNSQALTANIATLLKNAFSAAILVNNIFRCLCTLVDEMGVRGTLLHYNISSSIKRGLKSLANIVKISVTNFIMQTTRFPEFVHEYIETGVLEVLIMYQKHAFCVSTWTPAIDSILSKSPTLKFCIRNHLSFTDITVGNDFLVSKKKFEDFRIFQNILKEEVSPLQPIIVVNFNRTSNPSKLVVNVPIECFTMDERSDVTDPGGWCYCRKPGDPRAPKYLDDLNALLEKQGLVRDPLKVQRAIDFENVAKRTKAIAEIVAGALSEGLKILDLNSNEDCSNHTVKCHLKELTVELHCNFIPIGMIRSGCQFERAVLFKVLADQIGLPCTLQRSVDGKMLFNEVPLPVEVDHDVHCDKKTMNYMPWRLLRPTHIVDLMYNVGELYPIQSRQALQYLRLY